MKRPLRISMSLEDFNAIPQRAVPREIQEQDPWLESATAINSVVGAYSQELIFKDEAVQQMLFDPKRRKLATKGQRILFSLSALDADVHNGGLTQFFWNHSDLIDDVSDALKVLRHLELDDLYEKAVEAFLEIQEPLKEFEGADESPEGPGWTEEFGEFNKLLDLSWFDDAYCDQYEPNEFDKIVKVGMTTAMWKLVSEYVRTHPGEFIET